MVCVYGIAKNEEQFISRFMEAVGTDVDVYIGDTGSTDRTVELLKAYPNVTVLDISITPWRFDAARNAVLDSIPDQYDLYVSLDLDEIICSGWLAMLQGQRSEQVRYTYNWSRHPDGRVDIKYFGDKIHSKKFRWIKPVHEVLHYQGPGKPTEALLEHLVVDHYPDPKKSRGQYLELLEQSVTEDPDDPRNAFYLGREYFFYQRYPEAVTELVRYLDLPTATWGSERAAAMQYLAQAFEARGQQEAAEAWFLKATMETPEREPLIALAEFMCRRGLYRQAYIAADRASSARKTPASHYIMTHYAQNGGPEHIMSFALWQLGERCLSKKYAIEAVMQDPHNQMFVQNLVHYREVPDA